MWSSQKWANFTTSPRVVTVLLAVAKTFLRSSSQSFTGDPKDWVLVSQSIRRSNVFFFVSLQVQPGFEGKREGSGSVLSGITLQRSPTVGSKGDLRAATSCPLTSSSHLIPPPPICPHNKPCHNHYSTWRLLSLFEMCALFLISGFLRVYNMKCFSSWNHCKHTLKNCGHQRTSATCLTSCMIVYVLKVTVASRALSFFRCSNQYLKERVPNVRPVVLRMFLGFFFFKWIKEVIPFHHLIYDLVTTSVPH